MSTEAMEKVTICETPKLKSFLPIMHCTGCHYGMIIRIICETVEELDIGGRTILLGGVGCSYAWPMMFNLDGAACPHGRAPAMATALKRIHPENILITCQGDGDLGAIGLGCFMNALVRGEKLTTIFLNNAGYGMTGGQMAPTTLLGQVTTTTPEGRDPVAAGYPLHVAELAATMKGVAYSARVTVHTPANYTKAKKAVKLALQKQIYGIGYSFVEFLSACPAAWRMDPKECIAFINDEMVPEYPLGEFKNVERID